MKLLNAILLCITCKDTGYAGHVCVFFESLAVFSVYIFLHFGVIFFIILHYTVHTAYQQVLFLFLILFPIFLLHRRCCCFCCSCFIFIILCVPFYVLFFFLSSNLFFIFFCFSDSSLQLHVHRISVCVYLFTAWLLFPFCSEQR